MMLKELLPWRAKMAAKIVLARLPFSYARWSRLNLFKHGSMASVSYALDTFRTHRAALGAGASDGGFVALELGPGDSLLSAVIARLSGATRIYLIDAGAFASTDVALYRVAAAALREELGGGELSPERWKTVDDVLSDCCATYGTAGVKSLAEMPDASVDLSWSQAVLEHVRRDEFDTVITHLRRVSRSEGASSHQVDLRDHLGGRLNNLRFSSATWEGELFSRSGFYTNRLRYSEMLRIFDSAGFAVAETTPRRWDALPTPRKRLAPEFRRFADEDLLVQDFRAVLHPR